MVTSSEIRVAKMLHDARQALYEAGLIRSCMTQNQAFKVFGRRLVQNLRSAGKITPVKHRRKIYYKLKELEKLTEVNEV